ncbi:MAG: hypothetical protein JXB17_06395 [Bacteroidales bacterium]|nr:hypothetical protein [Bacteroidales bacterium]
MEIVKDLFNQSIEFKEIANLAIENSNILEELIAGISTSNRDNELRFKCHQILLIVSEKAPDLLYKYWDFFVSLIESKNAFHNMNGMYMIANLTKIDHNNRFDEIFDSFFDLLYNKKVSVAGHTALNSLKIVGAKPNLLPAVIERFLNYDIKSNEVKQKELVKAYIIEFFDSIYKDAENKSEIMEFVKNQLESDSPKTREAASKFVQKYNNSTK